MPKIYVTFGQNHAHAVNGVTFDKDSVACIECTDQAHGRELAFELFGPKFGFTYSSEDFAAACEDRNLMYYLPRGVMDAN